MWPKIYYSPDGETGSGEAAKTEEKAAATITAEQATQIIAGLGSMNTSMTQLVEMAKIARESGAAEEAAEEGETAEEGPNETDLELMSRKDLIAFIKQSVVKDINEQIVKPLNRKVDTTAVEQMKVELKAKIDETAAKHPDFWEWRQEMAALAGKKPGLDPDELYIIVRSKDAEKRAKIDAKYKEEDTTKGTRAERESEKARKKFGGMSGNGSTGTVANRKMGAKDASLAAWDEVVASMGGTPSQLVEE